MLKALFQAVFEVGLNLDLPVLLGVGAHFQLPGVGWAVEGEGCGNPQKKSLEQPQGCKPRTHNGPGVMNLSPKGSLL